MAGRPLPSPSARRPLVTPASYDKVKGKGAKNWASKCSRPNAEVPIPFPNQFPTSVAGFQRPYAPFQVRPYEYQCARPTALPQMGMDLLMVVQFKAQLSQPGLGSRGTGVFHAPRELLEYNRTNCSNIKGQLYILTWNESRNFNK
ncbi:hypothetical protein MtrunA17_Chr7g0267411 [Medicago truncatula]|uniref:Uncharacterized protein n=1 Tax=Medicago truncatula TaxID=3880 RepID=A0A396H680_MEDTR|nr:hypothetical protein MtrunA17_Chr7g0267411 [Medicago truncatula]